MPVLKVHSSLIGARGVTTFHDVTPVEFASETPYDKVAYTAASYPQLNPNHLGALGLLFGLRPRPASRCRFLELGCGRGSTLLALAQMFPESEFVGVDLSGKQIEGARRVAEAAGLKNLRLEHRSITDVNLEHDGEFDFIVSHGVFSWVPREVQDRILAISGSQLSPHGIAYVSFNTLPGWSHLRALREMLLYHTERYPDPLEKFDQARAFVTFLRETSPDGDGSWRARMLADFEQLLSRYEPAYFLHEYLESTNEPCYFHEFMARAEGHGLQYVCEASIQSNSPANLGPNAAKVIEILKRSVVEAEQYMDFARNTQFRSSLLCRSERAIDRRLTSDRLSRLVFRSFPQNPGVAAADVSGNAKVEFVFSNGVRFASNEPWIKAAMIFIAKNQGEFLSLQAIADGAAQELAAGGGAVPPMKVTVADAFAPMLGRCLMVGVAQPAMPDAMAYVTTSEPGERPFAPPLARAQAAFRIPVIERNLFSRVLPEDSAAVLELCDGTRTAEEIRAVLEGRIARGEILPPPPDASGRATDLSARVSRILEELAARGFLWKSKVGAAG